MPASGYTANTFTAGETPTTVIWNQLWNNDAAFNNGNGFNDNIIVWRHLATDVVPTGTVHLHAGSTAPSANWLICDGSAVSRTTYGTLFGVISTTYGSGDGSTTFNLPNLKGNVPVGYSSGDPNFGALGGTGGAATHTLTTAEMPVHNHGVTDPGHSHNQRFFSNRGFSGTGFNPATEDVGGTSIGGNGIQAATTGISTQNAGSGAAHSILQPFLVLNYIIKI